MRRKTMTRAKEEKLAQLHEMVATVLVAQVTHKSPEISYDIDGVENVGEDVFDCSPATLATAIKFLKDNSITCDIQKDTNLGALKDALKRKPKHSNVTAIEAARSLEAS
jgi:hypothetical protein